MFTEKEISAYKNIKAPDDLLNRITGLQKKSKKPIYFISAVAACFIFIITGILINNNQSNIVVNGQQLKNSIVFYDTASVSARTTSSAISIPIEIDASRRTEISVTKGWLSINGSSPSQKAVISESETIWWEIEPNDSYGVFEMKITDKKGSQKVTLEYENSKITVTKEKVK